MKGSRALPCVAAAAALLFAAVVCRAQGTSPKRGFNPAGSYSVSDIETINTTNGNLGLQIPIAALPPGRGGLPGPALKLIYNSKIWDTPITIVPDGTYDNYGVPTGRPQHYLKASTEGGWRYGAGYEVRLVNRLDDYSYSPLKPSCEQQSGTNTHDADYIYKVQVIFPDGSAHDLAPQGYQSSSNTTGDGYYNIRPDGYLTYCSCVITIMGPSCTEPNALNNSGTMTYYSIDGTYMRLDVPHDSDSNQWNNSWTIYMPDGTRVVGAGLTGVGSNLPPGYPGSERVYDRNNNYVDIQITQALVSLTDQLGRSITVNRNAAPGVDYVGATGFNNEPLTWAVRWQSTYVKKTYNSSDYNAGCSTTMSCNSSVSWAFSVVDRVDLPAQSGGLSYTFGYNGNATPNDQSSPPSAGWGELNSLTTPTGASVTYAYRRDNQDNIFWDEVLQNHPVTKSLHYLLEYDRTLTPATETWSYSFNFARNNSISTLTEVTAPDGGKTSDYIRYTNMTQPVFDDGLSYKTVHPDGTVVERLWASNMPYGHYAPSGNAYLRTELTSVPDASGNPTKTAVKDYDYDKNGNLTRVTEYDWVPYTSIPRGSDGRPTGVPAGAQAKRTTLNTYYAATQNASDTNLVNSPNSYSRASSPALRNAIAGTEVGGDAGGTLSRAQFYYDNPSTTGNLTETRIWDSTKGALSRPLSPGTYCSATNQYDAYGNRTLTTDARGYQTQYVYGPIGAVSGLYPTQVKTALGTAVQRTGYQEYDLSSGLLTRTTDADNNVSNSTTYDVFGRPILVVAAENKPEETRTVTVYSDSARRVVVRSDLNAAGDGKLVTVQHFDQLGRLRLSRRLEDASVQSETDEGTGIKVQARYAFGNPSTDPYSYTLVSNPYRADTSSAASSERTMGWTRTKTDRGGRVVQAQTFSGSGLPAPWGTNTAGTGAVTTAYNAEYTTVTDQANRARRSVVDALGRLVRVDEPGSRGGLDDAAGNPVQPTSYTYDALGNVRTVAQGGQQRYCMYDSLSRVTRSKNPEQDANGSLAVADPVTGNSQWSNAYAYDNNGNLTSRTDPRGVTAAYVYDPLNRNTSVTYSGGGTPTLTINRYYDGAVNGKGRLWWTQTVGVSAAVFDSYDPLGRPKQYHQSYWVNGAWGLPYTVSRAYDKAGNVKTQTYPSGHAVTYNYDAAGRLGDSGSQPAFSGNLGDGVPRTYAAGLSYGVAGGIEQERFGTQTPLYHKLHYNARGQLYDVRLSSVAWATDQWNWNRGALLNYYSTAELSAASNAARALSGSDNNGNLRRAGAYVPLDAAGGYTEGNAASYAYYLDDYAYDALNRLSSDTETAGGTGVATTTPFKQSYTYDRWGNRTINQGLTTGTPSMQFDGGDLQNTNRLYAPGDTALPSGQRRMRYDAAGNLVYDTYTGQGTRVYDAEGRITSAQDSYGGTSVYTYDAAGRRLKRNVAGAETWQVYGIDGELLAEYQAGAAPYIPTKEYGYRGSELLVTMSSGDVQRLQRFVTNLYYGALQRDPTAQELQDKVNQLASAGTQSQSQLQTTAAQIARGLFLQTAYETSPFRSDAQYVADLYYAYLQRGPDDSGLGWWTSKVPTDGRANVCNSFEASSEFQTLVTTLYGTTSSDNQRTEQLVNDFYLGAYGRFATATELQQQRDALNAAASQGQSQVQSQAESMGRTLFAAQVNDYSITDRQFVTNLYEAFLQRGPDTGGLNFWTSNAAGGPQNRQNVLSSFATCPPFRELSGALYRETFWLVSDHLGTPRMIVDKSGSLAGVRRHDYLPFGEELYAYTGGRTPQQGYTANDNVRQKFAGYERDSETNLDYAHARYYASAEGRFTSPDPLLASGKPLVPQSWNRYAYALNNPLTLVDPEGLMWVYRDRGRGIWGIAWVDGNKVPKGYHRYTGPDRLTAPDGSIVTLGKNGIATVLHAQPLGISTPGQGRANVLTGLADGFVPGFKQARRALGITVDENAPEHNKAEIIGAGTMIGYTMLTGAGEVKLAEEGVEAAGEAVEATEEGVEMVYHGTTASESVTTVGLDEEANLAAAGPDMENYGFSVTSNKETAIDFAKGRSLERGEEPVLLGARRADVEHVLRDRVRGVTLDPGEQRILPQDYPKVGPGVFKRLPFQKE